MLMHATATPRVCCIFPLVIGTLNVVPLVEATPAVYGEPEPVVPPPIATSPALHDAVKGIGCTVNIADTLTVVLPDAFSTVIVCCPMSMPAGMTGDEVVRVPVFDVCAFPIILPSRSMFTCVFGVSPEPVMVIGVECGGIPDDKVVTLDGDNIIDEPLGIADDGDGTVIGTTIALEGSLLFCPGVNVYVVAVE